MIELILWIIGITIFTVFGSLYARTYDEPDAIIAVYVAFILFSNLAASKIALFDLGFVHFFAPASVIIVSVTFLLTDMVNEKFGRKETQKMILIAFFTQLAISFFSYIIIILDPAPFWGGQAVFEAIFSQVPRIVVASWVAFLISENLDAYLFAWLKKLTKGRYLWSRSLFSSFPAMLVESVLFITIAFYGLEAAAQTIFWLTLPKWTVGLVSVPFIYINHRLMHTGKKRKRR